MFFVSDIQLTKVCDQEKLQTHTVETFSRGYLRRRLSNDKLHNNFSFQGININQLLLLKCLEIEVAVVSGA